MMQFLYLAFIKVVEWLLPLVAKLSSNPKLKAFTEGRKKTFEHLQLPSHPERYWFHCASLGEFEQARPVMESIKLSNPESSLVISFFSPSGYDQKKDYALAEAVFYLPLDTPYNAKRLIALLQPKAVFFIKYEIWYFMLKALFKKNIPVYLISANFRKGQYIFSFWGAWLFKLLKGYKTIFLQNKTSFDLLQSKGLTNIELNGDTRYDRVFDNSQKVKENANIAIFKNNIPLLILGSSWPKEESILLDYLKGNITSPLRIIIAPHDISDKHIREIQKQFEDFKPVLYTEFNSPESSDLMILNTIGHLASAYNYADIAFIGGGFTGQLHNILEPLSFGAPVVTGPIHHKFPEAEMARQAGVLFEIHSSDDLAKILSTINYQALKPNAENFIMDRKGATQSILNTLN
ncbi:MAG: glycosyltransferase N-terminal domain-containing protein [Bacteroidota bacterium]